MKYSIHGILKVRTNVTVPIPEYFLDSFRGTPDLTILSRKKLNFRRPVDNRILKGNYYFWRDGDKLLIDYDFMNAKLSVEKLFGRTKVECTNSLRRFCTGESWQNLVFAILSVKLIQKGYTFIHCGGLSYKGEGVLIAGMQDTGKSSTVLSLLDGRDFKFLGDDFLILGGRRIYAYPKEVRVSPRTLRGRVGGQDLKEKILKNRLLTTFVERYLKKDITRFLKIPRKYIVEKCDIGKIFVIGGYGEEKAISVDADRALNAISTLSLQMPNLLETYLDMYYHLFDVPVFKLVREKEKMIRKAVETAECFVVTGPHLEGYSRAIKKVLGA